MQVWLVRWNPPDRLVVRVSRLKVAKKLAAEGTHVMKMGAAAEQIGRLHHGTGVDLFTRLPHHFRTFEKIVGVFVFVWPWS